MDPITLSIILAGVGGAVGGAGGLGAAADRAKKLKDEQYLFGLQYEAAQKQRAAQQSILEGGLSVGTLDANAAKKQAAIEAAAAEGQARAIAGTSGASGGTPFYALDKQMFANQDMVNQVNYKSSMHLDQMGKQLDATMSEHDSRLGILGIQGANLAQDVNYANSFMGFLMPTLSGAASGASAGLSVANTLIGAGFTTEAVKATGTTLPSTATPATPATPATLPTASRSIAVQPTMNFNQGAMNFNQPQDRFRQPQRYSNPLSPLGSSTPQPINNQPWKAPNLLGF
jgi:hypothetical protein